MAKTRQQNWRWFLPRPEECGTCFYAQSANVMQETNLRAASASSHEQVQQLPSWRLRTGNSCYPTCNAAIGVTLPNSWEGPTRVPTLNFYCPKRNIMAAERYEYICYKNWRKNTICRVKNIQKYEVLPYPLTFFSLGLNSSRELTLFGRFLIWEFTVGCWDQRRVWTLV